MSGDLLALMWFPFLMCLVLTGIHAYLGFHVIAREVVFVDIALAQIAALGATAAFLVGYELETWESYAAGLGFTVLGALVLALTRSRTRRVSHEAVIRVFEENNERLRELLFAVIPKIGPQPDDICATALQHARG